MNPIWAWFTYSAGGSSTLNHRLETEGGVIRTACRLNLYGEGIPADGIYLADRTRSNCPRCEPVADVAPPPAPPAPAAHQEEVAALRAVVDAASKFLPTIGWMAEWAKLIDEDPTRIDAMVPHYRAQQVAYMALRDAVRAALRAATAGSAPEGASPPPAAAQGEAAPRRVCRASATADPPTDCDAPFCGCDPMFGVVIDMLRECGWGPRGNADAALDAQRRETVRFIWALCHQHGGEFALTDAAQRATPPNAEVSQWYDADRKALVWRAAQPPAASAAPTHDAAGGPTGAAGAP